jgi:MFS family permease
LLIKPLTLPILRMVGYKKLLISNTLFVAIMLWTFYFFNAQSSLYLMGVMVFVYGFLLSMQYSAMNSLAFADIDQENLSAATSVMGTLQQLAQSFGVAVAALCLRIFSDDFANLNIADFHYTFIAMGVLTLFSTLIFIRLKPEDGSAMLHGAKPAAVK